MASKSKIAILLPCYNEAGAIGQVVEEFQKILPEADIYVCDNNSTDGSVAEATKAGAIIQHEKFQGKGHVVRRMFRDIEADYYVMADGDGTYEAGKVKDMIATCQQGYDMVVGKRVDAEKGHTYRPGHVFGNHLLSALAQMFFGKGFTDILSGYRVFSRRFVKTFPAISGGFETETELTIYALMLKMNICELDTQYFARKGETTSKLNTYRDGLKILLLMVRLFKDYKPLLLFVSVASVFAMIFLALFIPIYFDFQTSGLVLKIPSLIVSVFCLMLSMLSLFTGFILDSLARRNLTGMMQHFNGYKS